jgi:hypothetical protein
MTIRGVGLFGGMVHGPYAAPVPDDYQRQSDLPNQAAWADIDEPVSDEEWARYQEECRTAQADADGM